MRVTKKTFVRLLKSPAILVSGISKFFLPENLGELLDRLKLILQEKEAGKKSIIINDKIVAIADKFLENKSLSMKQHIFFLIKRSN